MDRLQSEIEHQLDEAWARKSEGRTEWPGMTYEEGVVAALDWVLGNKDEAPMEDE